MDCTIDHGIVLAIITNQEVKLALWQKLFRQNAKEENNSKIFKCSNLVSDIDVSKIINGSNTNGFPKDHLSEVISSLKQRYTSKVMLTR